MAKLQCPACGANYNIGDNICPDCGLELPEPYAGWQAGEDSQAPDATEQVVLGDGGVLAALGFAPEQTKSLSPSMLTLLAGATVYTEDDVLEPGTVVLAGGRILGLLPGAVADPQDGSTYLDLSGMLLSAGFIDLHIHGMMGIDTNQAAAEDFLRISAEAARHGLTGLTLTTVACNPAELRQVVNNLRAALNAGLPGARLLGLHLESNFISMDYKGAQPPDAIFAPSDPRAWEITPILDEHADLIRIVTLAPELPGALEMIGWLRERGIIVSLGHSAATYEEAVAGIEAGATHVTHLFNAMSPLHHRNPGLVGAALESDAVFTEMVCDGVHVHPAVISTVITAKGAERFIPISDALQGAGLADGEEFYLGGQHVTVRDGVARLDSGTIAGSITTMDRIVRFLVERVGWDLGEALLMASSTPAKALEFQDIGHIAPGIIADLVVLDENLEVAMTLVGGKIVYCREASCPA